MIQTVAAPSGAAYAVLDCSGMSVAKVTGSKALTSGDTFQVWGSLNTSAAGGEANLYPLGTLQGSAGLAIPQSPIFALAWTRLIFKRTGGSTAGSIEAEGPAWGRPAPTVAALPTTPGSYSAPLDMGAAATGATYALSLDDVATSGDEYLAWGTNDLATRTPASGAGGTPFPQVLKGGGQVPPLVLTGYEYVIFQCVAHAAAVDALSIQTPNGGGVGNEPAAAVDPVPGEIPEWDSSSRLRAAAFTGAAAGSTALTAGPAAGAAAANVTATSTGAAGQTDCTATGVTQASARNIATASAGSATVARTATATGGAANADTTANGSGAGGTASAQSAATGTTANVARTAMASAGAAVGDTNVSGTTSASVNSGATASAGVATANITAQGLTGTQAEIQAQVSSAQNAAVKVLTPVSGGECRISTGTGGSLADAVIVDASQHVAIGPAYAAAGALLDLQGTTAGLAIPTLSQAQETTLAGVVTKTDTLVFNTDLRAFRYWNGSAFQTLDSLKVVAKQTTVYSAGYNELVPCDPVAGGASFPVTLPAGSAGAIGSRVVVTVVAAVTGGAAPKNVSVLAQGTNTISGGAAGGSVLVSGVSTIVLELQSATNWIVVCEPVTPATLATLAGGNQTLTRQGKITRAVAPTVLGGASAYTFSNTGALEGDLYYVSAPAHDAFVLTIKNAAAGVIATWPASLSNGGLFTFSNAAWEAVLPGNSTT